MQIGQFASAKNYSKVEPDVYPGVITKCVVVMDPNNPGIALKDKYDKNRLLVEITLDDVTDPAGGPIVLTRQLPISYGKNNSTGTHSALAVMIEAAMEIAAGNAAQRHVTTEQLVGKRVRVQTKNVTKDDKTYTNITDFLAPKKIPAQFVHAPKPTYEPIGDDEDLPF